MAENLNIESFPNLPGCYLYKDKKEKVIYVGKAKNLKKRISNYFTKKDLDSKTKSLVSNISKIDFIITNSEIEAFLLEDSLIKKYKPKYNINLKDSKSYSYLAFTNENFPRLVVVRKGEKQKFNPLFGPFVSGEKREILQKNINKIFKLRTCKKLPNKKCLRYDLDLCSGPCINKISVEDYGDDVKRASLFLKGETEQILKKIKDEMSLASKKRDYESAIKLRNQKQAIDFLKEKQNVERHKKFNEDIINFVIRGNFVYLMVFNIDKGSLSNKQEYVFEKSEDFFEEFISRFYSNKKIPKELIVPKQISKGLQNFLSNKRGSKITIKIPKKGELRELLSLIKKNIEIHFFENLNKIEKLSKVLNLQDLPRTIECFDISHFGGKDVVASMVQFKDGTPNKGEYRKFKIKSFEGNDDFRAMEEVITRRYSRIKKENKNYPDLILIDGGVGQLNVARESLFNIGIKIPIISLAKKFEEVWIPNTPSPIRLSSKNPARILLQQIRDEAHRFAIKYQKNLRTKTYFSN